MTIQLPVLLWTVICFLLLVLILHFLLFRPVLRVMDQRRARIRAAAAKKAENERLAAEYAAEQEKARAARLERQRQDLRAELDTVRTDGRTRLEAANEDRLRTVDEYSVKAEEDCARLLELLSERADALALSFADSLTK